MAEDARNKPLYMISVGERGRGCIRRRCVYTSRRAW